MKGRHSTPNGAAAGNRRNSNGSKGSVHSGILLFVLTALTLTSLITPTEQLAVAPNGTTPQQLDPEFVESMVGDFYRAANGSLNGTMAPNVGPQLDHKHRSVPGNGSHYLDYDEDAGADCSYSYNFILKLITMILYFSPAGWRIIFFARRAVRRRQTSKRAEFHIVDCIVCRKMFTDEGRGRGSGSKDPGAEMVRGRGRG